MKFTVEIEDFWLEEEEVSEALQQYVKNSVVREISESIKTQVDAFMDKHLKANIQKTMDAKVQVLMEAYLETGKVKGSYSTDPEMTIQQWMAKKLSDSRSSVEQYIQKAANQQGEQLRQRYDLLFASQLVTKLNEQGFLKSDIAQILLDKKDK